MKKNLFLDSLVSENTSKADIDQFKTFFELFLQINFSSAKFVHVLRLFNKRFKNAGFKKTALYKKVLKSLQQQFIAVDEKYAEAFAADK